MGSDLFFTLNTPIKRNEQGDYALLVVSVVMFFTGIPVLHFCDK